MIRQLYSFIEDKKYSANDRVNQMKKLRKTDNFNLQKILVKVTNYLLITKVCNNVGILERKPNIKKGIQINKET